MSSARDNHYVPCWYQKLFFEPGRATLMRGELERLAAAPKLSRDTSEQVSRSLG